MSDAESYMQGFAPCKATRILVVVNFLLLGLFLLLDKVGGGAVDSSLRRAGLDSAVALALQVWIVSSTLLATGLFVWGLSNKRRSVSSPGAAPRSFTLDGALLLTWWLTLAALCTYGFLLGMAG
jgi:hypothetical protein